MRSSTAPQIYFYCANRVEKTLPDGTVTRFRDYPWQPSTALFDELCPSHRAYPVLAPPFWRPFDGDVQHRLVRFQ